MRLDRVSVRKYRSIDTQADFNVREFTVIVGPNNQGKSNLLRAAVLAMEVVEEWATLPNQFMRERSEIPSGMIFRSSRRGGRQSRSPHSRSVGYSWEDDYPLYARNRKGAQKSTVINLEFSLSSDEQHAFSGETGISINERLPVTVSLKERSVALSIPKSGRGAHKEKMAEIARFISDRITLLHIPAVRTGNTALDIADGILASRRRQMLNSNQYSELLKQLEEQDKAAVDEVQGLLQKTLSRFVPGAQSVQLEARAITRTRSLDDIQIDDGVLTSLAAKGDGIQSLVALALTMEWMRSTSHPDKQLIIAVEEPESHLHPGAVHKLRQVLREISDAQQVIVTTHSQALVNRNDIRQNVIVKDRSAKPAKSLTDLRDALGVRISDSLTSAEVVVLSEGYLDETVLPLLLTRHDARVSEWINDGRLVFQSGNGGSKIYPLALSYRSTMAEPVLVLDSDLAGEKDVARLIEESVVDPTSIVQITRNYAKHSELEDLIPLDIYIDALQKVANFTFQGRARRKLENGHDHAWSDRLESIFAEAGIPQKKTLVKRAKHEVAQAVIAASERGEQLIKPDSVSLLERIVDLIDRKLESERSP